MNNIPEHSDVVIVGGGITGLAAAYLAAKQGKQVTVLEASNTFGGLLNTFEIGNNRLEFYYHHFFTHDAELNWLIKELGIADKLFFKKTSMGVFRNGKVFNFNTPLDLLKFSPISFFDKIRFGLTSVYLGKFAKWQTAEHISCAAWFRKWAGRSTSESLWYPLLNIKFGPYAEQVPLAWMIGRLRQRMNSRKNGDERLGYLEGSLQTLLDALLAGLKEMNVQLIANAPVVHINFKDNSVASLQTNSESYRGKQYLFTIPGFYLSALLMNRTPNLARQLADIKYFGAVCVILEMSKPLSDIYWLNIADKGFPFGGIIEHTNFIPSTQYNGRHIAYLSRYFAHEEPIANLDEESVKQLMLGYLPQIYPNFSKEDLLAVHLFRTNTAATICDLNFSEKVFSCQTELENMYIANMGHIYPDERSTNNAIRVAAEACRVMGIDTRYVPKNASLSATIGF